jgi:hypothetical protein
MKRISLLLALLIAGCSDQPIRPELSSSSPIPAGSKETAISETKPAAEIASEPDPATIDVLPADIQKLIAPLTTEQVREGWINLFDGTSLFGWKSNSDGVNWSVHEGTITADSGPKGLLLTTVPWADYELHCEFQMAAGGNSGIFLRTLEQPAEVTADCYELNIVDTHPSGFLTGSFVGRQKAAEPIEGSGGWKSFDVRCEGNKFSVDLDGKRVLDHTDDSDGARKTGFIGLQKNEGKIEFRNVRLRPLGTQPLFNNKDLAGWGVVPGSKAEFKAQGDTIQCVGGAGFLETEQTYGDFVLQLDAMTAGPAINSGFFFRAEPGTEKAPSNGYEVQVDDSIKDNDRTKPENSGTGAIFRRAEARIVTSESRTMSTITLVASGPRFATWVNGYPVVDWVDDRLADPNPRKGLRLEAGHISLQGHDPTTQAWFRNIRIAPSPQ